MPETTPPIKAALNLRVGAGFDVYLDVVTRSCCNKKADTKPFDLISALTLLLPYKPLV